MLNGADPKLGELTETVPPYVPAAKPAGFALTLNAAGVIPVAGVMANIDAPLGVVTVALTGTEAPVLAIVRTCGAGVVPPIWKLNGCRDAGLAVRLFWARAVSE
ncbi:MAG: hypothetical protein ACR2I2_17470 [Bryobacteraceae bacterium]